MRSIITFLLKLLYRAEVRGTLPRAERLVIIANHQSFLDAPLMWALVAKDALWVVHSQVMQIAAFRFLLKAVDYVVIDAAKPMAMKHLVEVIERGRPVIIFPEGRVTVTGTMMKVYDGVAFLAAKARATIAPVWIEGAVNARGFSRMGAGFPLQWFPKVRLTVLPPEIIAMPEARSGKLRRRKAGEEMRRLMQRTRVAARRRRTIPEAFLDALELCGRSWHMVEDATGTVWNYGGILKAALALGRLAAKLTKPGENVGVLMPNAAATLGLFLGLLWFRRVPAMLNFTAGPEGLQSALIAAQIRVVLTSRAFVERARLAPVLEKLTGCEIRYLEDLRPLLSLGDKLWLILLALRRPRSVLLTSSPESPAAILFTSGSEGKPKGVVLSHDSILANIEQGLTAFDVSPRDKMLSAMPVFHSFGLTANLILPVVNGIPLFLYPSPLHYSIIPEIVYDRDCTVLFGTNTFLKHYGTRAHAYDFRRVTIAVGGAEKVTDEVRQLWFEKFGVRVMEGYGATECSPIIAVNGPMRCRFGSVGEPLPGIEYRLEKVEGVDEGGLLHVRGPNVMLGYLRDSAPGVLERPSSTYGEGWYATGDLAVVDEEGFLTLRGRMKRFAKVAGEMVSLEVVERIAEAASPASVHASVSRPDPSRGETIVLVTQDAALKRDQLQQAARQLGAPELAIPRRIVYTQKIPLLGSGKKDYPAVSRLVESEMERQNA